MAERAAAIGAPRDRALSNGRARGHLDRCDACGHQAISYNSCRNRHCPKCQAQARERWLARAGARSARRAVCARRLHAAACAAAPGLSERAPVCTRGSFRRARRRSARSPPIRGISAPRSASSASSTRGGRPWSVIRTCIAWCRPVACPPIISAGSAEARRLLPPVKVLSRVFRGKFIEALRHAFDRGDLDLAGGSEHLRDPMQWRVFVNGLFETDWVVYAKPAFGGASAVLRDLGRYTHRVAISNHRLLAFDGERVTFQWKDYAHGDQRRTMTLSAMEFLRRFVQHILPRGFVRIRQSGFLANTCRRSRLALARALLASPALALPSTPATATVDADDHAATRVDLPTLWSGDDRRSDPVGAPSGGGQARLRQLMTAEPTRHDRRPRRRGRPRLRRRCVSIRYRSPSLRSACRAAPPSTRVPPPLARRRPIDRHRATRDDPSSRSIAGRRASGFLQVSLSKVPRHPPRAARRASRAESLPMNANDKAG